MKVIFEKYINDYNRKSETKTFASLTELENWIFGQMQQDYSRNRYAMWFPLPESVEKYKQDGPGRIEFRPCRGGEDIWIHQIEGNDGIIFSDGRFTSGQKYWTIDVQNWLVHCEQRRKNPKFNFAYENSQPEPKQITNRQKSKLYPPAHCESQQEQDKAMELLRKANQDACEAMSLEEMARCLMGACHCHLEVGNGCPGCPFDKPTSNDGDGECRLGVPSDWDF